MRISKILMVLLMGFMLLTSCKVNAEDTTVGSEEEKVKTQSFNNKEANTENAKKQTDTVGKMKVETEVSDYNFSVITVGTGTPKYSESQTSASTLIQYNGGYYLIDSGDGSYRNLEFTDFDFSKLTAILMTHHHMDHTTDFFDIFIKSFLANDNQIDVIGPPRTQLFVDFFNDVYLDDLLYRKTNIKEIDESYKDVILNYANTSEVIDAATFNIDGLNIQAEEMSHTMYNLSYRFEADNQSIVVTGDVNYDENLIAFAKEADVLVIDGTLYKKNEASNKLPRKYIEPFYEYGGDFGVSPHLTFEEMVDIAVKANVSTLVVTHYNGTGQERIDQSIQKIKESFDGEVIYATDMLEIGVGKVKETKTSVEHQVVSDDKKTEELIYNYNIVDTNQTDFYSDTAIITSPSEGHAFYGQDGSYIGNTASYTKNNDGTISDNVTQLMWAQDMGNKMSYEEALTFANNSELAGYDDWRIPTIKELYSLIQFDGRVLGETATEDLFIDTDYFNQPLGDTSIGEREIDAQTWSSTKYVGETMNSDATIFGVNFVDGRIKGYAEVKKRNKTDNAMYFRLVRGNTSYGENNFVDNGDGTITDLATGFMWQQEDSAYGMDWEYALDYSENLDYAGYDDWRLPNAKELQSIVDYNRSLQTTNSAAIDSMFNTSTVLNINGDINYPYFWSSTSHLDGKNPYAYGVYIAFGEAEGIMNDTLLDVHGAGAQRSDPKSGNESDYPVSFGPQGDIRTVYNYVRCVRNN
jgi:ribonuclease BN (tRNA processing enzyme)